MKQVIVVNSDVKMSCGKKAAQVAHASLGAYRKAKKLSPELVSEWEAEGERKIVLTAPLEKLLELRAWADSRSIPSYLVRDAGLTELPPGTVTALGIGPAKDGDLKETEGLKLL